MPSCKLGSPYAVASEAWAVKRLPKKDTGRAGRMRLQPCHAEHLLPTVQHCRRTAACWHWLLIGKIQKPQGAHAQHKGVQWDQSGRVVCCSRTDTHSHVYAILWPGALVRQSLGPSANQSTHIGCGVRCCGWLSEGQLITRIDSVEACSEQHTECGIHNKLSFNTHVHAMGVPTAQPAGLVRGGSCNSCTGVRLPAEPRSCMLRQHARRASQLEVPLSSQE